MPSLQETAERFGVELIIQFGSTSTGRETSESDLDIAVAKCHDRARWSWDELLDLEYEIWNALRPPREIDLVDVSRATPLLLGEIARHGKPIYAARTVSFVLFSSWAMRRYEDNEKCFARLSVALRRGSLAA